MKELPAQAIAPATSSAAVAAYDLNRQIRNSLVNVAKAWLTVPRSQEGSVRERRDLRPRCCSSISPPWTRCRRQRRRAGLCQWRASKRLSTRRPLLESKSSGHGRLATTPKVHGDLEAPLRGGRPQAPLHDYLPTSRYTNTTIALPSWRPRMQNTSHQMRTKGLGACESAPLHRRPISALEKNFDS